MGILGCILAATGLAFVLPAIAVADVVGCPAPPDGEPVRIAADANGLVTGDGREIVLAGIAAPPGRDTGGATWRLDPAASAKGYRIAPLGPADRYGRIRVLAFAADGALLQEDLVRAGHAVARPGDGGPPCMARLLAAEAAAREAGAGLWRDARIVAKASDAASLSDRNGLYALVEGRIVSVGYGSRMVFLDFGRSFRTDFTVLVQQSLVSRLLEAGIAVDSLAGRAVRVRGVIEESGGPAIRLADPLALELLDRAE
jgi:micrococcal nuclease